MFDKSHDSTFEGLPLYAVVSPIMHEQQADELITILNSPEVQNIIEREAYSRSITSSTPTFRIYDNDTTFPYSVRGPKCPDSGPLTNTSNCRTHRAEHLYCDDFRTHEGAQNHALHYLYYERATLLDTSTH